MTNQQKLTKVREAIEKANRKERISISEILFSKIGIAEVLRAIGKTSNKVLIDADGNFCKSYSYDNDYICNWSPDKDDINLQSEKTIDFLFDIFYPNLNE